MEARRLLDAAPFAPDIVELLKQVFDDAWASVAPTTAAHRASITRLSLAHAIVAHAASGERDFDALKTAALVAIESHPPREHG